MSKVIRCHPVLALLHALAIVLLLCAGVSYLVEHATRARGQPVSPGTAIVPTNGNSAAATIPATDPLVYSRVQQLRQRLALTDLDLGAMGCSQAQATSVLSSLLGWYQANADNWSQAEAGQASAQRQVDEAVRQINVGPRDEPLLGQLPTYRASLASANASFDTLVRGAANVASSPLSSTQQQAWSTVRANVAAGVPDSLRYAPSVTAAQASQSGRAMAASAGNAGLPTPLATSLTFGQQQAVSQAQSNQHASMDGVLAAEQSVLPPPFDTTPN